MKQVQNSGIVMMLGGFTLLISLYFSSFYVLDRSDFVSLEPRATVRALFISHNKDLFCQAPLKAIGFQRSLKKAFGRHKKYIENEFLPLMSQLKPLKFHTP